MRDKYAFIDTVGADEQTHQHVPQHYLVTAKDAQARELLFLVREAMKVAGYKVLVYQTLSYSWMRP